MTTKRAYFQSRRRAAAGLAAMLVGAVAIIAGTTGGASAASVTPEFVPGSSNKTCAQFAPAGETWGEIKVDPPNNGSKTEGDRTVTILNKTDKTFDWTSNFPVVAVYVKAGSGGSNLYRYNPASQGDTNLSSPGDSGNAISHISFCYLIGGTTSTSTSSTSTTSTTVGPTTTVLETTTTVAPTTTESVLGSTATTEEETTTTEEAATTTEETEETVAGVVVGRQLPRTGSGSTLPMTEAGLVLVGLGFAFLASSRLTEQRI